MFSSMTMASSTTRPIASTQASRVNTLIENPSAAKIATEPMIDTGIAISGTSVARQLRRNRKIISTTRAIASYRVL